MKNSVVRTQPQRKYENFPLENNLPLSIGANFHDDPICRNTNRRSHTLLLPRAVEYAPHTEYIYNGGDFNQNKETKPFEEEYSDDAETFSVWLNTNFDNPEDVKNHVVCFLCYFVDHIPEGAESKIVRRVGIRYHMQDNSISVLEAKQENSGIVQSTILSRRQVPRKMDDVNDIVMLEDFRIGGTIKLFNRVYHILDMDKRSRLYYEKILGQTVPNALPWPTEMDKFTTSMQAKLSKSTHRLATSDDMDQKRSIEQQLTGIYTKHSTEDILTAQSFFRHTINEHLTFLALWDDRENISGDLRFVVIRLYLENNTVEIIERRKENSGRLGGCVLLSRQRVARPGKEAHKGRSQEHTFGVILKQDFLVAEDMKIGETYLIHGRHYYVYDADLATREYMKKELGIELAPACDISSFVESDMKKPILFFPPPPNGFGSERESRANWITLNPKPRGSNMSKTEREGGRVMVFLAELAKPLVPGDEKRKFIISFFRDTDEVSIFEKPESNSGFIAGRFLAKGVHRKPMPDGSEVPFTPEDFQLGKDITILERPFRLLQMSEDTKKMCEVAGGLPSEQRIKELLLLFKQQIQIKFTRSNDAYCTLAPGGVLGYRQISDFLRSCSCTITEDEALLLVHNLVPSCSGIISFDDFLDLINVTSSEHMDEASLTSRSVKNVSIHKDDSLKHVAHEAEKARRRRRLAIELRQKLIQRRGTTQEQFRLFGCHNSASRLNRDTFRRSLNEIMHFNVPKEDEDTLVSILFDGRADEKGDITYKQFQEFIDLNDMY